MIEPINETTFRLKMAEDEVEIGDINATEFKPHAKLKRWGEECFLCVKPAGDITEIEFEIEGDKVKSKYKIKQNGFEIELESEFYALDPNVVYGGEKNGKPIQKLQNELGGLEFEIILKRKPSTNKIIFDIETKGLKFYYQPPLILEEMEYSFRPDNVVGSYAVYHNTRTSLHKRQVDAEKYKCGKAFHIYRPRLEDADGDWVWGDLNIDIESQKLTVTIPQDFLDNAKYPVHHAAGATFGYETIGGSYESHTNSITGSHFTCPESGTADSITVHCDASVDPGNGKCAIYKEGDDSLVGPTGEVACSTWDWLAFDFSAPKPDLTNIEYWLVLAYNPITKYIDYDSNGSGKGGYEAFSYNSFPASESLIGEAREYSIYCTYTPTVAGIVPQAMRHYRNLREA